MVLAVLSTALISACGGGGGGGGVGFIGGSEKPVISGVGGEGTVNNGGTGASFYVTVHDGHSFKIMKSGSVDTAFDTSSVDQIISGASISFGAAPLDVTSDMTIPVIASNPVTTPAYYMYVNNATLYHWDGAAETVVTGIHVHAGATLTLALNRDWFFNDNPASNGGLNSAGVSVNYDIVNDGVITALTLSIGANETGGTGTRIPNGTDKDMGGIYLESAFGAFVNNGTIDVAGKNAPAGVNGGWGGVFSVYAGNVAINRGTINASSGSGENGGQAGWVELDGDKGVWNSGPVSAKGGAGTNGGGGAGNWVGFNSYDYLAPVYNSGTIDVSGGDGTTNGGDVSEGVEFSAGEVGGASYASGGLVNSGRLIANGGSGSAGNGGNAGYVNLIARGANLRNSGAVEIRGGKGAGGSGGSGGTLYVHSSYGSNELHTVVVPGGSIQYSGGIVTDGGAGDTGGSAGKTQFDQEAPVAGDIILYGYSAVNLAGGSGKTYGGDGGSADMHGYDGMIYYNEADFTATGGAGETTSGGNGGHYYVNTVYSGTAGYPNELNLTNLGNITTMGGKGVIAGGTAGYIQFDSEQDLKNSGHLNAKGGDASGAAGTGGGGNSADLWAKGSSDNSGLIETSGGYGAAQGGAGSWMTLRSGYGQTVNSGNIYCNGGNTASGGTNGSAYTGEITIEMDSSVLGESFTTRNSGALQAKAGTGGAGGLTGSVYIDGSPQ
jgi:hypothetical protein